MPRGEANLFASVVPNEDLTETDKELSEEFRQIDLLMNNPGGFEQELVDNLLNAERDPDEVDRD